MNQFPPSPRVSHLGRFKVFRKFTEIFAAQGAPPVSLTKGANGNFFTPLGSRVIIYINYFLQVNSKVKTCLILFTFFAAGVTDTGGAP
jgi:hypothetical protein